MKSRKNPLGVGLTVCTKLVGALNLEYENLKVKSFPE